MELLIHCGLDTVNLNGQGFTAHIKQGQRVNAGELLLELDKQVITQAGYDPITMVVVTNYNDYNEVKTVAQEQVTKLDDLLEIS